MNVAIKEKTLDNQWWDNFLSENENFKRTKVFKDSLSDREVSILHVEVLNVLRNMFKYNLNFDGFRFYIDGEEQNDEYVKKHIFSAPPLEDESIEDFAERVFKDKKFGIIMNFVEKYSNEMSKIIRLMIDPLIEKVGYPLLGLDGTIFIGNYGFTPLGIHRDRRGENVIHFHLGPGEKTMYNWDEDVYKKVADSKPNNENIEPILKDAQEYKFSTGDVYFMPWNKWHVGYSGDLSVGVTLWFNNPTKKAFTEKMFHSFALQYINDDEEILDITSDTSNVKPLLSIEDFHKDASMFDILNHVSSEYRLALDSNAGWSGLPLSLSAEEAFNLDKDYGKLNGKTIKAPEFYKIQYSRFEDELIFFARGYKMEIRYHSELENIIDKLNTHKEFEINILVKDLIKDWPLEACLFFISLIYDKKAVEIVE